METRHPHDLPDPRLALLVALLFPRTLRAMREAAASFLPRSAAEAADSRSACAPETATPGAATPGAALPCNHSETQGMNTLPQGPVVALPPPCAPLADVGSAQHTALMRWHNRRPVHDVTDDLRDNPRYPFIAGGAA